MRGLGSGGQKRIFHDKDSALTVNRRKLLSHPHLVAAEAAASVLVSAAAAPAAEPLSLRLENVVLVGG